MYRQTSSSLFRSAQTGIRRAQPASRRFLNTAPPSQKPRSWKSSAARWGIAIAGIYYYNTHPIFADQAGRVMRFDSAATQELETEALETVDSYTASKKQKQKQPQQQDQQQPISPSVQPVTADDPAELEEEASQQGAFNEETGEINWDCPCLGGMAHGPCGEEFKAAFSCFVYSDQEPKGLDCIDKFKGMQDCFRAHPEVYAAELEDDDPELEAELAQEREALQKSVPTPGKQSTDGESESTQLPISPILSPEAPPSKREAASTPTSHNVPDSASSEPQSQPQAAAAGSAKEDSAGKLLMEKVEPANQPAETSPKKFDEKLDLMPKAWHDASDVSEKTEGEKESK